jgi:hypothetical protein
MGMEIVSSDFYAAVFGHGVKGGPDAIGVFTFFEFVQTHMGEVDKERGVL